MGCTLHCRMALQISLLHAGDCDKVLTFGALRCFASLQVKIYGGAATEDITASTTHVVVVPPPHNSSSGASTGQPGQLLGQLLKEHGALPALKTLHRRLQSQQAHIVTQRCGA